MWRQSCGSRLTPGESCLNIEVVLGRKRFQSLAHAPIPGQYYTAVIFHWHVTYINYSNDTVNQVAYSNQYMQTEFPTHQYLAILIFLPKIIVNFKITDDYFHFLAGFWPFLAKLLKFWKIWSKILISILQMVGWRHRM